MGPRISAGIDACRRFRWRCTWATLTPALLLVLCGCTTTIVPPARVADPQPVFVLDHGRHTSLVLPHPDGLVRYAYGDWRWYALEDTGVSQGMAALLWPTRGTLGRRVLAAPATEEGVRRSVGVVVEHLYMIQAEGTRVAALRAQLEGLFTANRATRTYSAASDLEFVHHPDGYSAFNNSNHMLADWLKALGCDIRGSAMFARWELVAPR
ncbi:MAG: hypothetical protein AB7U81_14825 [Thiohalomonadaceae bacterium]